METKFWTRPGKRGLVEIGFSKDFLDELNETSYGIILAREANFKSGKPCMFVEMSWGTLTVESPVSGELYHVNDQVFSRLDAIKVDDPVFIVRVPA